MTWKEHNVYRKWLKVLWPAYLWELVFHGKELKRRQALVDKIMEAHDKRKRPLLKLTRGERRKYFGAKPFRIGSYSK